MEAAGFVNVETVDVTAQFLETAQAWRRGYLTYEAELRPLLGDEYDELCKNREDLIAAVEDGLLERTMVFGEKPA